jgi:hypothetical protein
MQECSTLGLWSRILLLTLSKTVDEHVHPNLDLAKVDRPLRKTDCRKIFEESVLKEYLSLRRPPHTSQIVPS